MLPPVHPPLLELPTQQPREQTGPAPVQAREEREVETEAMEDVDTTTRERNHEERSTGPPDLARTPSTPVTVSERADRPRRETRRPARPPFKPGKKGKWRQKQWKMLTLLQGK